MPPCNDCKCQKCADAPPQYVSVFPRPTVPCIACDFPPFIVNSETGTREPSPVVEPERSGVYAQPLTWAQQHRMLLTWCEDPAFATETRRVLNVLSEEEVDARVKRIVRQMLAYQLEGVA